MNFKTKKISYKVKSSVENPEEKQFMKLLIEQNEDGGKRRDGLWQRTRNGSKRWQRRRRNRPS